MAENKKSFLLYCDLIHTFEHLTLEQRGKVITWVLNYVNDLNPDPLPGLLNAVVEPIKQQLKRDLKKYENICERNKANGSKGGRPKKPKKPSGLSGNPKKPKKADTDTDIDTDIEKDILLEKFKGWALQSDLDVLKVENQFHLAWDYYEELNWYNSKGKPIKNIYLTIRTNWFKNLEEFKPKKKKRIIPKDYDLSMEEIAKLGRGESI